MKPNPLITLLLLPGCIPLTAQTSTTTPCTPVTIENTNATLSPSTTQVPQASPARPTVTAPAHIPPTGYLQFEQGFNQADSSPSGTNAQFALNQTTKIALTPRLLVQFITQPYTYNHVSADSAPDAVSNDPGDLQTGVQAIALNGVGAVPVLAFGYIRRVRAGSSANLDVGGYSQSVLLLASGDLKGGYHYDSNVAFNEQNEGEARRPQFAQSVAVSHSLFAQSTLGKLGGVVEISHFTQPFVKMDVSGIAVRRANGVNLLFASVYSVRPNIVLDAALEHGLTSTSTQWQGSFGFTYLLPHRLWKNRHPVPATLAPTSTLVLAERQPCFSCQRITVCKGSACGL